MNPRVKHVCGRVRPKREKEEQFDKKKKAAKRGVKKKVKKVEKNMKKGDANQAQIIANQVSKKR